MRFLGAALVAAGLAITTVPTPAQAQLLTPWSPYCGYWMGIDILNQFHPVSQTCVGSFQGSSDPSLVIPEVLKGGWVHYADDINYVGSTEAGGSGGFFASVDNGPNGTIVFNSPLTGNHIFVLEAGNQFSIYYFQNLADASTLAYSTLGTAVDHGGALQGLDRASLYSVPEPGTLPLLVTGLLGLFAVTRRRKVNEVA